MNCPKCNDQGFVWEFDNYEYIKSPCDCEEEIKKINTYKYTEPTLQIIKINESI